MAETRRRIIVDGLEPGAIVRFPLILRSVASAFQPPRLVVAFLLVLALVLPGRAWDAVRGPRLEPGSLLGLRDEDAAARERAVRRAVLQRWAPLTLAPAERGPEAAGGEAAVLEDPGAAIEALDAAYGRWRELGGIVGAGTATETDERTGRDPERPATDAPSARRESAAAAARRGRANGPEEGGEDRPGPEGAPGDAGDAGDARDPGDAGGASDAGDAAAAAGDDASPAGSGDGGETGEAGEAGAGPADDETTSGVVPGGARGPSVERYRRDRAALAAQLPRGEFTAVASAVHGSIREIAAGLLTLDLGRAWTGLRRLFVDVPVGAWTHAPVFALVFAPLVLAVWALGGGALCRMSTVFIARGERSTVLSAVAFARAAWPHLVLAPLVPLLAAGLCLVPAVLVGLLLHVPAANVVGGVLYGVAVLAAIGAAVLLLGLGLGAPLVTAAVAAERCDAIDAAQRPYAYLLRRPVHLVGYLGVAVVATTATYVLAAGVAGVALDLAAAGASVLGRPEPLAGAGGPPLLAADSGGVGPIDGPFASIAATVAGLWRELVLLLAAAAVVSGWASATTAAFLLLRQSVDGQDPEEIWLEGMVPGTFAHRVPLPAGDHGVAPGRPRSPRRSSPRHGAAAATGPGPGVPAVAADAAAEEDRAAAPERVAGEELGDVLAGPDAPRPSGDELAAEIPETGRDAGDQGTRPSSGGPAAPRAVETDELPEAAEAAEAPGARGASPGGELDGDAGGGDASAGVTGDDRRDDRRGSSSDAG